MLNKVLVRNIIFYTGNHTVKHRSVSDARARKTIAVTKKGDSE